MAYRVRFPENKGFFAENPHSQSSISLLKNTGNSGNTGNTPAETASDQFIEDGRIIAVEICSTVLDADIWLAFGDAFDPKDGQAIFYAHELPMPRTKTSAELREIHKVKLVFGPRTRVRQ